MALHHFHQAQKIADSVPLTRIRHTKIQLTSSKLIFLFATQYHGPDKSQKSGGHGSNDKSAANNMNDSILKISDKNIAIPHMIGILFTLQNALHGNMQWWSLVN